MENGRWMIRIHQSGEVTEKVKFFIPSHRKKHTYKSSAEVRCQENLDEIYFSAWKSLIEPWREHKKIPLRYIESASEREKEIMAMKIVAQKLNEKNGRFYK